MDGWEERPFLTHIVTVSTRQKYVWWLYFALLSSGICTFPVTHPVVPLGQGRLRIIFHASNTSEQIIQLVEATFSWVEEMCEIEAGRTTAKVSNAAREFYKWMKDEGVTGYGFTE